MSYNNVVAVGCSFTSSDAYNLVDYRETYGGVIAEHFGAKFYNLGKSGGSLHRTNRKILEWCGENKDKFKDTLIIVGMTSLGRLEVWSNRLNRWYNHSDYLQTDVHLPPDLFKFDWSLDERKKWFMNFYNHSAEFTIANELHTIERTGFISRRGKVKVDVDFYKINDSGEKISLNGDQRNTTNKNIKALIGTYEDFILTSFSSQTNNAVFLDHNQTEKKDILARFLGLGVFDQLYDLAQKESSGLQTMLKNFMDVDYDQQIADIEAEVKVIKKTSEKIEL